MVLYHPVYIIHEETKRICDKAGIKIEFDPTQPAAEYRRYLSDFLERRPEGDNTPITFKITECTRLRSKDRRNEFLIWTENQLFTDALKNEVTWKRRYCGIYKIPKIKWKTTGDGQGGTKTVVDDYSWLTLYEFPYNEENCNQVLAEAENPNEIQLNIQTEGSEEIWGFRGDQFEMWKDWPFNALLEFARTKHTDSKKMAEQINPFASKLPDQSKEELFPDVQKVAAKQKQNQKQ